MDLEQLTIKEIKNKINNLNNISQQLMQQLKADSRKGVQQIAQRIERKKAKAQAAKEKYQEMRKYEKKKLADGYDLICGIDEAGRGPLAGSVVAGAVILGTDTYIPGLDDSKKLSEKKREELFDIIYQKAEAVGVGIVDQDRIDEINILQATYEAMTEAVDDLGVQPNYLLIDSETIPQVDIPQAGIEKGDSQSVSIAAASIIAKVTRDRMLVEYDEQYPEYGFAGHKGYGTKSHRQALEKFGPCDIHRKSYQIVQKHM
ncbi:ribonuclease HII [Halanaerobacter jeridensis]|uniref:Ribonuclease HII n=1 Tax=Halanaerobacter jeridensis TaxID=706427 RepID=A0A939BNI9_9FIRM|nr:ribonuclease HII [Halanaerobacter jeridensis]MBM7555323.1 ribonuclease HII [Halanaerobacter jeridensis]